MLLFLPLFVCAAEHIDPYSVATTKGMPSTYVGGLVNPITGVLLTQGEDVVVAGAEPIRFTYSYMSRHEAKESGKWLYRGMNAKATPLSNTCLVHMHSGEVLQYSGEGFEDGNRFDVDGKSFDVGYTNDGMGFRTGQLHQGNSHVFLTSKHKMLVQVTEDGTKRYFSRFASKNFILQYHLVKEELSNGHIVKYEWTGSKLKRIATYNGDESVCYAILEFEYTKWRSDREDVILTTSDGQRITFRYAIRSTKHNTYRTLIRKFGREIPDERYDYDYGEHERKAFLGRIAKPDERGIEIKYYKKKTYDIQGRKVEITSDNDERRKRIRSLLMPLDSSSSAKIPAYTFLYYPAKVGKYAGVTEVFDALGHKTRYGFSNELRMETISYDDGKEVLFSWDGFDLKKKQIPSANVTQEYTYDHNHNLTRETLRGNLSGEKKDESYSITRTFLDKGRVETEVHDNGKKTLYRYLGDTSYPTAIFVYTDDEMISRQFFEYDSDNLLTCEVHDDGTSFEPSSLEGVRTRKIKKLKRKKEEPYCGMVEEIEERYYSPEDKREHLLSRMQLRYGSYGKVVEKDVYDSSNTLRYTLKYRYEKGKLILETDPLGREHTIEYDENGNIVTEHLPNKAYVINQTYDYSNRVIKTQEDDHTQTFTYDTLSNQITATNAQGNTIHTQYDLHKNPIQTIEPPINNEKPTIRRSFDALGNTTSEINQRGFTTQTEYTSRGKPTKVIYPDGSKETYTYSLDGYLKTHTNTAKTKTVYTTDILGRNRKIEKFSSRGTLVSSETFHFKGALLTRHTSPDGITTTFAYDGAGRVVEETKPTHRTTYTYDALGRQNTKTEHLPNAQQRITAHTFDLAGRVIQESESDQTGEIISQKTTLYDDYDNPIEITILTSAGKAKTHYAYDAFNRVTAITDPLGHVTIHEYDDCYENGTKKVTTDPLGRKTTTLTDTHGRVASIEKPSSFETFSYTLTGKLELSTINDIPTLRKYDERDNIEKLVEANERETSYTYYPDGNVRTITKPDGAILSYTYDPLGHIASLCSSDIHYTYSHDVMGRLVHSTDHISNTHTSRLYNEIGKITSETLANGLTLSYDYDTYGRRIAKTLPDTTEISYTHTAHHLHAITRKEITHTYQYALSSIVAEDHALGLTLHTYDLMGRVTDTHTPYARETIHAIDGCENITQYNDATYAYDAHDHLIQEPGHTYEYDGAYNRMKKDGVATSHTLLHQIEDVEYDENGNQKNLSDHTYTYDALDRLVQIDTPDTCVTYTYDSLHRRTSRTCNGKTTFFLYDDLNEIGATDETGHITELRVLGKGKGAEIGAAVLIELSGTTYLPFHDHFGNLTTLINLKTHEKHTTTFTAFGETSAYIAPWGFRSKRTEHGLVNFGRRSYCPSLGRWITPDPKGYSEGPNLYQFLRNNPRHQDLYGAEVDQTIQLPEQKFPDLNKFVSDMNYVVTYVGNGQLDGSLTGLLFPLAKPVFNYLKAIWNITTDNRVPYPSDHSMITMNIDPNITSEHVPILGNGVFTWEGDRNAYWDKLKIDTSARGLNCVMLHNSSHGVFDLFDTLYVKFGGETRAVRLMEKAIKEVISMGKKPALMPFSECGQIAWRATQNLSPEDRSKVSVYTFGTAKIFSPEGYNKVTNFISKLDYVTPFTNPAVYSQAVLSETFRNEYNIEFVDPLSNNPFKEHTFKRYYENEMKYVFDKLVEK